MAESKYLFERIKRTASKAIEAERTGDLKIAFDLYLQAADLLNQLIALEKNPKIRDSYYVKAKEYIGKAKEIKMLQSTSKIEKISDDDAESKTILPSPPKYSEAKDKNETFTPPPPPPPEKKTTDFTISPLSSNESKTTFSDNLTGKIMRGEDSFEEKETLPLPPPPPKEDIRKIAPSSSKPIAIPPAKQNIIMPTKTTYENLFDNGQYRDCIIECTKSVDAELRVRMGLFDEQLTLGMLIESGLAKGMETLKDFKFVNILFNRIDHENYRPSRADAERAIAITTKILMS